MKINTIVLSGNSNAFVFRVDLAGSGAVAVEDKKGKRFFTFTEDNQNEGFVKCQEMGKLLEADENKHTDAILKLCSLVGYLLDGCSLEDIMNHADRMAKASEKFKAEFVKMYPEYAEFLRNETK